MELLLIIGAVFAAFLIGRLVQFLTDARSALGKGGERNPRRR
ncbi:MAG: hypothetical protein ACJ786_34875 [Catenulispora sp.]